MKKTLLSTLTLGAALLAVGCQSTYDKGPYLPQQSKTPAYEDTERFVLLDPGAQRSVTCTALQERYAEDGRLQVVANLRNRENRRIQVQTQCVFKDAQGFTTEETPWQNVILTENAQEGAVFTAMKLESRRYTIRVRQAR